MKLYYSKGACSLAVRIVICETGIPFEYESVDLKTKKTKTGEDYLKINPKGSVPTITLDNGEVLTENAVIQQYLADTYNATKLLPPLGDFKRYRVLEWLNFVSSDLHKGCGPMFNASVPEKDKEEIFRPALKNKLKVMDQHLSNHKYLTGDEFTLPDGYLFVILFWMPILKIDISDLTHLTRYFADLNNRKAIQQAVKEDQGL